VRPADPPRFNLSPNRHRDLRARPEPRRVSGPPNPRRRPLRLLALAVTAALALPALAAAQSLPAMPTLDETPAQRTARRAAMTPPVPQEDVALQAAVASPDRPAADVARDV